MENSQSYYQGEKKGWILKLYTKGGKEIQPHNPPLMLYLTQYYGGSILVRYAW